MEEQGQRFREAWIRGVQKHYPGTPKPGYIAPLGRDAYLGAAGGKRGL